MRWRSQAADGPKAAAAADTGDNLGVAKLFHLPATMIQGSFIFTLRTPKQVALWHSGLPCSGHIVSIKIVGRYATAVFRLGNRPKTRCDAPGTLAAARFFIVNGKIVGWEQVPPPSEGPTA
jgi:hypothetical protein